MRDETMRQACIRRRAHEIYRGREGRPGNAIADWLEAEKALGATVFAGGDLILDRAEHAVTIKGELFPLTDLQFDLVARLAGDEPGWVSGVELKQQEGMPNKIGRIIRELPEEVRGLIDTQRGTSYRLSPP